MCSVAERTRCRVVGVSWTGGGGGGEGGGGGGGVCFFFFNDTATTEIYTLSLHDALPILGGQLIGFQSYRGGAGKLAGDQSGRAGAVGGLATADEGAAQIDRADGNRGRRAGDDGAGGTLHGDRKSTRLNSSH